MAAYISASAISVARQKLPPRPAWTIFSTNGQTFVSGWYLGLKKGIVFQKNSEFGQFLVNAEIRALINVANDHLAGIYPAFLKENHGFFSQSAFFRMDLHHGTGLAGSRGCTFQQSLRATGPDRFQCDLYKPSPNRILLGFGFLSTILELRDEKSRCLGFIQVERIQFIGVVFPAVEPGASNDMNPGVRG